MAAWGKLSDDHRPVQTAAAFMVPSDGVDEVIFRTRQTIIERGWTRFDVAAPFVHYDSHGTGLISVVHTMAAMAELGASLPKSEGKWRGTLAAIAQLTFWGGALISPLSFPLIFQKKTAPRKNRFLVGRDEAVE